MAIRAALLEPARSCSAHLDELIKKLREIKVSGCLNIFSYSLSSSSPFWNSSKSAVA